MPSWYELWLEYKGRILGIVGGIGFGIVYLVAGLVNMLIFAILVFIGYTLGKRFDAQLDVLEPLKKLVSRVINSKGRLFK